MLTMADKDKFINDGPFWELHSDVLPTVTRFEITDTKGHILESWERDKNGRMVETTKRDQAREELIAAQEAMNKLEDNNNA